MSEGELKKLQVKEARLQSLFSVVQDIYDLIAPCNVDKSKRGNFLAKAATLDLMYQSFETALNEIQDMKVALQEDYEPSFQQLNSFMDLYGQIKFYEKKFSQTPAKEAESSIKVAQPKLPSLELPSFSGNITNWPTFYETFKSLIHSNNSLTDDQKVQYLVSKLQDQALGVCAGIPPVGANYNLIWTSLVERYQDIRYLAGHYVDNVLNFKTITHESHLSYNQFIDKLGASVVALQALNIEDLAQYLLYSIAIKKLDSGLRQKFEAKALEKKTMPKFSDLLQFVKDNVKVMERSNTTSSVYNAPPSTKPVQVRKWPAKSVSLVASHKKVENLCQVCKKGSHQLYQCDEFNKLDSHARKDLVKALQLCFNCFGHHSVMNCTNKNVCKICKFKHNTLLHLTSYDQSSLDRPSTSAKEDSDKTKESSGTVTVTAVSHTQPKSLTVLLSTVKVTIPDNNGDMHTVRMLLDSGSMSHFITSKCCHKLGIPIQRVSTSVGGIGTTRSEVKGVTAFTLHSRFDSTKSYIIDQALVVDKITNKLPICLIDTEKLFLRRDLKLSDDEFYVPGDIDGLIGAELFAQVYGKPKNHEDKDGPLIIESTLGDIIMGKVPILTNQGNEDPICTFVEAPLESLVQKFWTLEEVPTSQSLCEDDKKCEEIFCDTFQRRDDGRYSVALPFKSDPALLGDSYKIAERRFLRLEKRLSCNPEVKEQYKTAITEYIKEGYAVPSDRKSDLEEFYMPHHGVYRPDKLTTKVRVVFDLSCASSNGTSLNDLLHTGPTLYNDLFELLLKFRMFPIACTADIKKMFLQIYVHEEDRRFQKFLWRDSPEEKIKSYEMKRVVFGMRSSPYLAQRVLHQVAEDEKSIYPLAAQEIKTSYYMDDYLSSFLDENQAISTFSQCVNALKNGGFELTKLASNNDTLLKSVPESHRLMSKVEWDTNSSLKVLGTQYCPAEDKFSFTVNVQDTRCTKRNILSTTARIFDVLGLVSPVTILAKLLIKDLWKEKIDWDEIPPSTIQEKWNSFIEELPLLNKFQIPRHVLIAKDTELSIIGFCDASEKAMGACIYVQVTHSDNLIESRLLCGKSKVSPMKYVTIPRLELCGALLLAKLMSYVLSVFKSRYEVKHVLCFSDSTVALSWIASQPLRWKTFVANRVSKIQDHVSSEKWFHVPGIENPADCLSRGILPHELIKHPLWLSGPQWLTTPIPTWNLTHITDNEVDVPEEKITVLLTSQENKKEFILLSMAPKFSQWDKLLRAIVYVLKFSGILPKGNITVKDMEIAEERLLQELQEFSFSKEIENLKKNESCSNELMKLRPFMNNNLIRCGGRISNADHLAYEHVHPVVLPKKHHVVDLLIDHCHKKNFHTGPHLVISILRRKYWILGCRDVVRRRLRKCNVCFKLSPKPLFPVMGDLPKPRVEESMKTFVNTGVDYAGPLNVTISKRRGVKSQKAYLCLFICLSTKAVHLELASDLSTSTFLLALRRFIARRGGVKNIYSDQGTNFIGASNVLNELYKFVASDQFHQDFKEELLKQRIEFHFNPPASPHHGGLWESNIRQVKAHLYKTIGSQVLTFEEMTTLFTEIEAILNSRPLIQLSPDSGDPVVLTPAHFLLQNPQISLTDNLKFQNPNLSLRYKLITQLLDSFWKRWSMEYLSSLQVRNKWFQDSNQQLRVGLLVLIKSDNAPVSCWPLGRIIQVFPGKDGVSRVALVQTKSGVFKRPAVKLCPLPSQ